MLLISRQPFAESILARLDVPIKKIVETAGRLFGSIARHPAAALRRSHSSRVLRFLLISRSFRSQGSRR